MKTELGELQDRLGGRIILVKGEKGPCAKCPVKQRGGVGFICKALFSARADYPCRGRFGKYTL